MVPELMPPKRLAFLLGIYESRKLVSKTPSVLFGIGKILTSHLKHHIEMAAEGCRHTDFAFNRL